MHLRDFKAGEVIFTAGDQGAGAILVLSGEVRVSVVANASLKTTP